MSSDHNSSILWKDRKHILWFPFTFEKYRVANGRIYCHHGLINQREHECLLYRILDITLKRSLAISSAVQAQLPCARPMIRTRCLS